MTRSPGWQGRLLCGDARQHHWLTLLQVFRVPEQHLPSQVGRPAALLQLKHAQLPLLPPPLQALLLPAGADCWQAPSWPAARRFPWRRGHVLQNKGIGATTSGIYSVCAEAIIPPVGLVNSRLCGWLSAAALVLLRLPPVDGRAPMLHSSTAALPHKGRSHTAMHRRVPHRRTRFAGRRSPGGGVHLQ